ncbi:MAG TPA: acetate uptake transporter [Micromonosporaceae bacterium]|jgi:hypothetical protein|nr:acetate uptake transporter [Micromonosporaceae bacterium]
MAEPEARAAAPAGGVADPAPLGLAAFALTTFLLSVSNAGWTSGTGAAGYLGYALAYGGLVQLLAGMWEFRRNNTFGAVAFSSYGGFWIGLFLYSVFVHSTNAENDLGWILLAFAIFNTYMLISSARINMAVFAVFLVLELTEIVLFIGFFSSTSGIIKTGGVLGVITAVVAWYTSFAGVLNSLGGSRTVPVGTPLMR